MFNRFLNKLKQISLILFIFSINFLFCSKKNDSYLILPIVDNTSGSSNSNNTNTSGSGHNNNPASSYIDPTFNSKGFVVLYISSGYSKANSMIVDFDEKILIGGHCFDGRNTNFCLAKFNSDGSLDTTFGNSGKAHINILRNTGDIFYAYSIEFDRSLSNYQKPILMSGYCNGRFCIIKLNYDGSWDKSFGSSGVVTLDQTPFPHQDHLNRYTILPTYGDLFYVAYICNDANSHKFCISRLYYNNGTLDTTFGTNGTTKIDIASGNDYVTSIKFQNNDKIVVAGSCSDGTSFKFCVARLNLNGSLDTSFGTNGKTIIDIGSGDDYATSLVSSNFGTRIK